MELSLSVSPQIISHLHSAFISCCMTELLQCLGCTITAAVVHKVCVDETQPCVGGLPSTAVSVLGL